MELTIGVWFCCLYTDRGSTAGAVERVKKVRVLSSRYKSSLSAEGAFANLSFDL